MEIQETIKPPALTGKDNQMDSIRQTYENNEIALELEGSAVDETTTSFKFWKRYVAMETKYKRAKSNAHELITE